MEAIKKERSKWLSAVRLLRKRMEREVNTDQGELEAIDNIISEVFGKCEK